MPGKLYFLAGLGAGYVLGARAGRGRYEQIAAKAQGLWEDPRVQATAHRAERAVVRKANEAQDVVADKASQLADRAGEAVRDAEDAVDDAGQAVDRAAGGPEQSEEGSGVRPRPLP
ncbi:YtxH domain-containing protein [Nocardioides sp. GY 10113]|uniref:YtxH domain-containing protein n=1 Tax=Nocardioides sp. GY 10113 TaxID=2569761 RepID=UPI0010A8E39A|nr:YtxH domain-containing protein [Nocardioides sp. GY 10113]TIC88468.1 YtxH domain-containing protein [Nocardioides sp. GY 10113]